MRRRLCSRCSTREHSWLRRAPLHQPPAATVHRGNGSGGAAHARMHICKAADLPAPQQDGGTDDLIHPGQFLNLRFRLWTSDFRPWISEAFFLLMQKKIRGKETRLNGKAASFFNPCDVPAAGAPADTDQTRPITSASVPFPHLRQQKA